MFKTSRTIDTNLVMASQKYFTQNFRVYLMLGMEVFYIVIGIIGIVKRALMLTLFALIFGLILLVFAFVYKQRQKKIIEKRQQALSAGGDALKMSTSFEDDGIYLINDTNEGVSVFQYSDIKKVYDFNDISIFFTNGRMIFYVFKNQLSAEDIKAMMNLWTQKNLPVKKYNKNLK